MKKKLIAIVGAISMMASMSMMNVASAGTVDVNYDAVASTPTTAVYELYAKNYSGKVEGLQIVINLDETIVDMSTFAKNASDYTIQPQSNSLGVPVALSVTNKRSKAYKIGWANSNGLSWTQTEPIAIVSIPLLLNTGYKPTIETTIKVDSVTDSPTINVESILVQSATVATGTVVNEDAASDAATYFTVETTAVADATPYWYATVDGAAKKTAYKGANIAAGTNVKLGLVSVGSVSNAKIVWEVKENK